MFTISRKYLAELNLSDYLISNLTKNLTFIRQGRIHLYSIIDVLSACANLMNKKGSHSRTKRLLYSVYHTLSLQSPSLNLPPGSSEGTLYSLKSKINELEEVITVGSNRTRLNINELKIEINNKRDEVLSFIKGL